MVGTMKVQVAPSLSIVAKTFAGETSFVTIKVPLSNRGKRTLASGRRLHIKIRVGFNPLHKGEYHSAAFAKVTFKH